MSTPTELDGCQRQFRDLISMVEKDHLMIMDDMRGAKLLIDFQTRHQRYDFLADLPMVYL